ncbi:MULTISPECIES: YbjN domain-containing protein [unclassified Actinomyces]|uniref:YbjN domain-containing protein n=1 Tax=unclassified Actinomyces TaxID=2609248 RepID=UPI002016DA7F|nr:MULTISPECIES: YbjN domain-containing protein [unclassified Actinomyces]MCL3777563.1 YbjN domain-containing protein [Actinomyces sp. AC-20-1]MCL3790053.1 YbjN domain-containing protein [Actinomyces sp. 187325]MCL3791096.1 YbjN domain-containing protein [Actinomyces sp. 186855]MCL3794985.1 YbjN domain-containing protein [Actinomyces sp. 217892]
MPFLGAVLAAPGVPAPLTRERLLVLCSQAGWSHRVGPEGELRVSPGQDEVALHQRGERGEVLLVRSTWHVNLDVGVRETVRRLIEDHHRRTPWPQAHLDVQDQGLLLVRTAQAVDLTEGVTDDQLRAHVADALGAAQSLFGEIAALLGLGEVS